MRYLTLNAPPGRVAYVLDRLPMDDTEVERLLSGAGAALEYLRDNADTLETINRVYVLDESGRLLGVTTIRSILTAPAGQPVSEFMTGGSADLPLRPADAFRRQHSRTEVGHRHH